MPAGRPKQYDGPRTAVQGRVPLDMANALDRLRSERTPPPSVDAVVVEALRSLLEAEGYWPPSTNGGE